MTSWPCADAALGGQGRASGRTFPLARPFTDTFGKEHVNRGIAPLPAMLATFR
ncbi:MAG: hypothetical protein QM714_15925 [Nocardioides sp.]|uniref:hypothetical protein n=1 Tax=Nocardioides sp. TaxID=35761 RepID=UPI0039E5E137